MAGTVIQASGGEIAKLHQYVTSYTVSYSLTGEDGDWTDIDGTYEGAEGGLYEAIFPVAVLARYVKLHPKTWTN